MRIVATSTLPSAGSVIPAGLSVITTESVPDAAHEVTFESFSTQPVPPTGMNLSFPGTKSVHSGPSRAKKTVTGPLSFAGTGSTPSGKSDAGVSLLVLIDGDDDVDHVARLQPTPIGRIERDGATRLDRVRSGCREE